MADQNPAEKAADAAKDKMGDLENKLDKHSDKLPQLSKGNKDMIGNFLPWGIGAFGLLALFWAKDLWDGVRALDSVSDALGDFGSLAAALLPSSGSMWIGIVLFLLVGLFVGLGFMRGVLNNTKEGWNFFFYAMVATVVAGLFYVFMLSELSSGRGWLSVVVGLGGLYGLFQLRDSYKN